MKTTPLAGVSTFVSPVAVCARGKALKVAALLSCFVASVTLTSCIQHSGSGGSNPLVVLANNGSSQSALVGTAYAAPLVAQVSRGGTAAKGVAVTFTAPSSGASGTFANGQLTETDTSDSNGLVASSTFTADTTAGQFQVSADASGAALNATFGLANISTSQLTLAVNNGSQQSADVGTAFATPLMVRVTNNGNAVPNITVTFAAPSSGASGTFTNGKITESDVTDSNGLATSSTFTANTTGGQYQVTASISGGPSPVNLYLTNTSAAQLNISVMNGSMQSANIGKAFGTALQVRISNNGTGVQGVTVTFTAPSSGASGTFINSQITESDVTDANGNVSASTFTANNVVGSYQVTASIAGGSSPGILYLTNTAGSGVPAVVQAESGTPQAAVIGQQFAQQLQAGVADGNNQPLANIAVTFTAPSSGASATFSSTGTSTETVKTLANGVATSSTLTANSTTGNFTVNATVSGVAAPAAFSLTNSTATSPAAVIATGGTPQRGAEGSPFPNNLVATVVDASGNPVSGASVTFAAPASGASGTFPNGSTVTTDSNGNATAAFTANSTAGAYTVTATVNTLAPANFALMNTVSGVTAYTFYLSGQEASNSQNSGHLNFYAIAGSVLVDPTGIVVGGEEDYNDAAGFTFPNIGITTGSLSFSTGDPAGQGTLTLFTNNSQIGVSGTETFKVQFVNTNHALIIEFDDTPTNETATGSGSMDVQTLGTPSGGYAFTLSGVDPTYGPVGFGGVFASGGTILNPTWSGTVDISDGSSGLGVLPNNPSVDTLSSMDVYGRGLMTHSIQPSGLSPVTLNMAYYMVGTKALRLIDIDSAVTAAGSAFSQGTNATSATNAGLGQSVFSLWGNTNPLSSTYYGSLGQFSTSNTSSPTADLAGVADEDELAKQFKQASAITGTYQIQSNGYGTLSITSGNLGSVTSLGIYLTDPTLNLNDPNNNSTDLGGALLLDLDATLTGGAGVITPQTDTSTTSFAGNYAVGWQDINELDGVSSQREFDMLAQGSMVANGKLSVTGAFSDPFETLTNDGTLSTGDTCNAIPQVDSGNLGSGRYSMLEANKIQNPWDCILNLGTGVFQNFETIMYQASGTQLFWYQRSLEPLRPAQLFMGPLEQQGSLNGIPATRGANGRLKSTGTRHIAPKPEAQ